MKQLFALKKATHQNWTASGKRIPVTVLAVAGNVIVTKSEDSTVLGFGKKKDSRATKPMLGMLKKNGVNYAVRSIRKMLGATDKNQGDIIVPSDIFTVGDKVKVTGTSKGLGFAGVVKRHGFAGGPKTHGQSDRERAPGSIGNRTTPGRVFRNKRMAGRGGNKTVTVENLQIVAMNDEKNEIWVNGVVPGAKESTLIITKMNDGAFEGLFVRKSTEVVVEEVVSEASSAQEATPTEVIVEEKTEPKVEK